MCTRRIRKERTNSIRTILLSSILIDRLLAGVFSYHLLEESLHCSHSHEFRTQLKSLSPNNSASFRMAFARIWLLIFIIDYQMKGIMWIFGFLFLVFFLCLKLTFLDLQLFAFVFFFFFSVCTWFCYFFFVVVVAAAAAVEQAENGTSKASDKTHSAIVVPVDSGRHE